MTALVAFEDIPLFINIERPFDGSLNEIDAFKDDLRSVMSTCYDGYIHASFSVYDEKGDLLAGDCLHDCRVIYSRLPKERQAYCGRLYIGPSNNDDVAHCIIAVSLRGEIVLLETFKKNKNLLTIRLNYPDMYELLDIGPKYQGRLLLSDHCWQSARWQPSPPLLVTFEVVRDETITVSYQPTQDRPLTVKPEPCSNISTKKFVHRLRVIDGDVIVCQRTTELARWSYDRLISQQLLPNEKASLAKLVKDYTEFNPENVVKLFERLAKMMVDAIAQEQTSA